MQIELKSLQREVGITFIFVTHDQEEAMALSDRIALLREGFLEQVAEPREIYGQPSPRTSRNSSAKRICFALKSRTGWREPAHSHGERPDLAPGRFFATPRMHPTCSARGHVPRAPDVSTARFRGRIRNQTFGGAMDMLEIDCGDSQTIRARIPSPGPLGGEHEFEFRANDAIAVRDESSA